MRKHPTTTTERWLDTALPANLPDETIVRLITFLYQLTHAIEDRYAAQIYRYDDCADPVSPDCDSGPPF